MSEFLTMHTSFAVSSHAKPGSGRHGSVPSQYPALFTNVRPGSLPRKPKP